MGSGNSVKKQRSGKRELMIDVSDIELDGYSVNSLIDYLVDIKKRYKGGGKFIVEGTMWVHLKRLETATECAGRIQREELADRMADELHINSIRKENFKKLQKKFYR